MVAEDQRQVLAKRDTLFRDRFLAVVHNPSRYFAQIPATRHAVDDRERVATRLDGVDEPGAGRRGWTG